MTIKTSYTIQDGGGFAFVTVEPDDESGNVQLTFHPSTIDGADQELWIDYDRAIEFASALRAVANTEPLA